MQLHNITPTHKRRKRKRIGRGGARGKYSGRGIKGQRAHSSGGIRPAMRDIIKKIHKKRGYRFASIKQKPAVINIADLEIFKEGATISPQVLVSKKLVYRRGGSFPDIKILGNGDTKKKFHFSGVTFSEIARKKLEKAGSSIK